MKNIELKMPKVNTSAWSRRLPHIFLLTFLIIGLLLLGFGYYIFKRAPQEAVVLKARNEIDEINISFDKEKIYGLFDSSYDTSKIKDPAYTPKNPFLRF